jgi:hypothetical protein
MKTIITTVLFTLFIFAQGYAQTENTENEVQTIFGSGAKVTGWFIDFGTSYSKLNGETAHLPSLAGGVLMNDKFKLGLMGKTLSCHETYLQYDNLFDEPVNLVGGYGGLFFEASPIDNKLVHISFPLIAGAGGAEYLTVNKYPEMDDDGEPDYCSRSESFSSYWVIEPGVNVEVNVTGFMRIYAGYSYRWMMGLDLENTSHSALNGSNFNFGVRFGKL